jgi:hypothetical protein
MGTKDNGNTIVMTLGNVGIGTAAPAFLANAKGLDIAGTGGRVNNPQDGTERIPTLRITDTVSDYGSGTATLHELRGGIEFVSSETSGTFGTGNKITGAIYAVNEDEYNRGGGLAIYTNENTTTPTERMRISQDGNVGIGTTSPGANLEIYKESATTWSDNTNTILTGDVIISNNNATDNNFNSLTFATKGDTNVYDAARITARYPDHAGGNPSGELILETKNNSGSLLARMLIDRDGNVGIGTALPQDLLHVANGYTAPTGGLQGGTLAIFSSTASNYADINVIGHTGYGASISFGDTTDTNLGEIIQFGAGSGEGSRMRFIAGGTETMNLRGGFVGIGDSSPDAHLKVENTSINTDDRFIGIYTNHIKDDGGSASSDDYYGIRSDFVFNDGDAAHGVLMGVSTLAHNSNSADSNQIRAINAEAKLSGTSDVENMYGAYIKSNVDDGTVDAHVYGMFISTDVESESSVGGDVTSLAIIHNDEAPAGGNSIGIYQNLGATTDYGYFQDDESDTAIKWTRDGTGYWDGVADTGNADYAEYFESTDGSVIPIGNTVVLENGKIRQAGADETPIGIIRPHSAVAYLGNSSWSKWQEKYIKDDYGAKIVESFTKTKWSEEITFEEYSARGKDETGGSMGGRLTDSKVEGSKAITAKDAVTRQKTVDEEVEEEVTTTEVVLEDGKYVQKTTTETVTKIVKVPQYDEEDLYDEDGEVIGKHQVPIMETVEEAVAGVDAAPDTYFREHKYHSDRLPEGVTAPDDAKVLENAKYKRKKLNPDYDESMEYSPREDRDEWHVVGLLGQIPITKGQPLADNWTKMKDVSDTVEMYFVK